MTSESNIVLLRDAAKTAILDYARMARTSEPPPESFIRDVCALELHRKKSWTVRIEFPARHTAQWDVERPKLVHLSKNFLIDLVCFRQPGSHLVDLEMLVELKLWADVGKVLADINRLRELSSSLTETGKVTSSKLEIYVVCVPHYPTLAAVQDSISYFFRHYRFDRGLAEPFLTGDDPHGAAAAVIILDANDCTHPR
jgi:hypothetical protein